MHVLDWTLASPEENLAADHALLDCCEETGEGEILRFWESPLPFVVLGHANKAAVEADLAACVSAGIPILRRISGGGAVLQGPGCLNYSLILRHRAQNPFEGIAQTHALVLGRHQEALEKLLGEKVRVEASDLTLGGRKFSGNAQRRKRNAVLYHGTFLYDFDLNSVGRFLRMPSRQPAHRAGRAHGDFLVNIGAPAGQIKQALQEAWECTAKKNPPRLEKIQALVAAVYSRREWSFKY